MSEDLMPHDPTVEYTDKLAIKEITPDGSKHFPLWKPLNLSRRRFIQGFVCSGIAVLNTAILSTSGARPVLISMFFIDQVLLPVRGTTA